jgi:hypothetical protein
MKVRISLGYRVVTGDLHPTGTEGTGNLLSAGKRYRTIFTRDNTDGFVLLDFAGVRFFGWQAPNIINSIITEDRLCLVDGYFEMDSFSSPDKCTNIQVYEIDWNEPLETQPNGINELKVTFETFKNIDGLSKKYTSELDFYGDGYDFLLPYFESLQDCPCLVEVSCDTINYVTLIEGFVKAETMKVDIQSCSMKAKIESTSLIDKIQNEANKDVPLVFELTNGDQVYLGNIYQADLDKAYMFGSLAGQGYYTTATVINVPPFDVRQPFWRAQTAFEGLILQITRGNCLVDCRIEADKIGIVYASLLARSFYDGIPIPFDSTIRLIDIIEGYNVLFPLAIWVEYRSGIPYVVIDKKINALTEFAPIDLGIGKVENKIINKETTWTKGKIGYSQNFSTEQVSYTEDFLIPPPGGTLTYFMLNEPNQTGIASLESIDNKITLEEYNKTTNLFRCHESYLRYLQDANYTSFSADLTLNRWDYQYRLFYFFEWDFGNVPDTSPLITNEYFALRGANPDLSSPYVYVYNPNIQLLDTIQNHIDLSDFSPYAMVQNAITLGASNSLLTYTRASASNPMKFVYEFNAPLSLDLFYDMDNTLQLIIFVSYLTQSINGQLINFEFDVKTQIGKFLIAGN